MIFIILTAKIIAESLLENILVDNGAIKNSLPENFFLSPGLNTSMEQLLRRTLVRLVILFSKMHTCLLYYKPKMAPASKLINPAMVTICLIVKMVNHFVLYCYQLAG